MPHHLKVTVVLIFAVLWCSLSIAARSRVSIWNRGLFGTEPVDWVITVTVEPMKEHRLLVVEVDGAPGEYRSSDFALDGVNAAKIRQVWFKGLRAGCYDFAAKVKGSRDRESPSLAEAHAGPVSVFGREGDPCG